MQHDRANRAKMLDNLIVRLRAFIETQEQSASAPRSPGEITELRAMLAELEHLRKLMPRV